MTFDSGGSTDNHLVRPRVEVMQERVAWEGGFTGSLSTAWDVANASNT